MRALYHQEGFDLSKNCASINKYFATEAFTQPLHEIEHFLFKQLLALGKDILCQFVVKKISE